MIQNKKNVLFLQQVKAQYPAAFKKNYLFYSMIKTQGMLDDLKELIPWLLAGMIFVSLHFSFAYSLEHHFPEMSGFRAHAIATLGIMLFFMALAPLIIKQIKHSSVSLYQHLQHTPLKLAILILLEGLNIACVQSLFLQAVLFFFAMSFGFVRFYKENLFRAGISKEQYFYLQETRRVCFWAYKQSLKLKLKLKINTQNTAQWAGIQQELEQMHTLHLQLMHYEHQLCKKFKHLDLDDYLDEISQ